MSHTVEETAHPIKVNAVVLLHDLEARILIFSITGIFRFVDAAESSRHIRKADFHRALHLLAVLALDLDCYWIKRLSAISIDIVVAEPGCDEERIDRLQRRVVYHDLRISQQLLVSNAEELKELVAQHVDGVAGDLVELFNHDHCPVVAISSMQLGSRYHIRAAVRVLQPEGLVIASRGAELAKHDIQRSTIRRSRDDMRRCTIRLPREPASEVAKLASSLRRLEPPARAARCSLVFG